MYELKGKTVLITGAAKGPGRELALAFGREGAVVLAADRAAAAILKGVKRRKALVVLTPAARFMHFVKRLSPDLYRVAMGRPMTGICERLR